MAMAALLALVSRASMQGMHGMLLVLRTAEQTARMRQGYAKEAPAQCS